MGVNVVIFFFFFSSRRRHTRCSRDWSSDVCSSDLGGVFAAARNESRLAGAAELLPALRSGKIGAGWCFGDEDGLQFMFAKRGRLGKEPPDRELRDEDARFRVREQLQLFLGSELVIE